MGSAGAASFPFSSNFNADFLLGEISKYYKEHTLQRPMIIVSSRTDDRIVNGEIMANKLQTICSKNDMPFQVDKFGKDKRTTMPYPCNRPVMCAKLCQTLDIESTRYPARLPAY